MYGFQRKNLKIFIFLHVCDNAYISMKGIYRTNGSTDYND